MYTPRRAERPDDTYACCGSVMGEGRAGFQWSAIVASPVGQRRLTALSDRTKADLLAKSFLDQKMTSARAQLNLTGNNKWRPRGADFFPLASINS